MIFTFKRTRNDVGTLLLPKKMMYELDPDIKHEAHLAYLQLLNLEVSTWVENERKLESENTSSFLSWIRAINFQILAALPEDVEEADKLKGISSFLDNSTSSGINTRLNELNTLLYAKLPYLFLQGVEGRIYKQLVEASIFDQLNWYKLVKKYPFFWLLIFIKAII